MEWSKIKNIILITLVAANLFLLGLVALRGMKSAQYEESARAQAVAVLEQNGIALEKAMLPKAMELATLTVERDTAAELTQAQALLGEGAQQTGGVGYAGAKGAAQFYANGEFSAKFAAGAYVTGGAERAAFAAATMQGMGFESELVSEDAAKGTVVLRQLWQGAPIFSCDATLVFAGDELKSIGSESHRLTGTPQVRAGDAPLETVTVLMRFLDFLKKNGDICSRIDLFAAGYTLDTQSAVAILTPTWRIETDTGGYYVNALSGEVRAG